MSALIRNKVGVFLTNPVLEHVLTQDFIMSDLRDVIDLGKIFLANSLKGIRERTHHVYLKPSLPR